MALVVRELSESTFKNMANDWCECLRRSDSDPLFMSWPWLYTWWETWSQTLGLNLRLIGVFTEDGRLIGIGPFYQRYLETPVGLRLNRLHFMGNAWRLAPTVRTEYCSLIADKEYGDHVRFAIYEYLMGEDWDELIVCDVAEDSCPGQPGSSFLAIGHSLKWLARSKSVGVRIDATASFLDWLGSLGKHTRLKAFNRRVYLANKGHVSLVSAETDDEFNEFFLNLNRFHEMRWGKPAFNEEALRFHKKLIKRLQNGNTAQCSSLMFNGRCISVLYDLQASMGRYNLQSGYIENFDQKVSLGTLHLGFAIEKAFVAPNCIYYDLLAGHGKTTNYKNHLNGLNVNFRTYQIARHRLMKAMYSFRFKLPFPVLHRLNRFLRL